MKAEKTYKRLILPDGLKPAEIVPKTKGSQVRDEAYHELLTKDFDKNRIQYRLVYIHGVPVHVKVEQK